VITTDANINARVETRATLANDDVTSQYGYCSVPASISPALRHGY
jgi:hypothetical protein